MTALKLVRYGAWAVIALIGIISAFILLSPPKAPDQATGGRIGGPFALPAHTGSMLDSKTLAGKPYALFFGFTQCPDVCPATMLEMTDLLKEMDAKLPAQARDFRVFFITVDPERDDLKLLGDYLSAFDRRITGLRPTLRSSSSTHRACLPALSIRANRAQTSCRSWSVCCAAERLPR
jgi:protein SCO1